MLLTGHERVEKDDDIGEPSFYRKARRLGTGQQIKGFLNKIAYSKGPSYIVIICSRPSAFLQEKSLASRRQVLPNEYCLTI